MFHAKTQRREEKKSVEAVFSLASWRLGVRYFLFCGLAIAELSTVVFAEEPFPKSWSPDLDRVVAHLREELKDAQAQQAINRIAARLTEVRDAQLALVYIQLFHRLSAKEQALLQKEQAAWIKQREQSATEASHTEEGGSLAPYNFCEEFLKQTDLRIKELQGQLQKLPNQTKK